MKTWLLCHFDGRTMKVGIIGAGHIAGKIARTLAETDGIDCLAVGSRSLEKAEGFASEFGTRKENPASQKASGECVMLSA